MAPEAPAAAARVVALVFAATAVSSAAAGAAAKGQRGGALASRYIAGYEAGEAAGELSRVREIAAEIRCPVCERVVEHTLQSLDGKEWIREKKLLDRLEADVDEDLQSVAFLTKAELNASHSAEQRKAEKRVISKRSGCNKHLYALLKDNHVVRSCDTLAAADRQGGPTWCLTQLKEGDKPAPPLAADECLTYSAEREAVHAACEAVIAPKAEALAKALAKQMRDWADKKAAGKGTPQQLADEVGLLPRNLCKNTGRCEPVGKKDSGRRRLAGSGKEL
eukprot:TRINITY_DN55448_c0_g1_i1.p1 TRINITY_DN55448_c0_g1~~TRINITY_DN55448_c0_g1_i1.p1  ORF type:complete len:278 (-),score=83.97 TRINITY_DN55448_c0_g1_i1:140-973(-)